MRLAKAGHVTLQLPLPWQTLTRSRRFRSPERWASGHAHAPCSCRLR